MMGLLLSDEERRARLLQAGQAGYAEMAGSMPTVDPYAQGSISQAHPGLGERVSGWLNDTFYGGGKMAYSPARFAETPVEWSPAGMAFGSGQLIGEDLNKGDANAAGTEMAMAMVPGAAKGRALLRRGERLVAREVEGLLGDELLNPAATVGHNGAPPIDALASVERPAGSNPRYRGAAPNRTTEYARYTPREVPGRMQRLIAAADDQAHPINSMFDTYIEKGKKLNGPDWYNTEELRDWFVGELGEEAGDARWREFAQLIGATSTGSDVASNFRNASFYNALDPEARVKVATRVAEGGITPAAAARELGLEPANTPTNYNYGHVMQGNHAKNVLAQIDGGWETQMPEGLTKAQQTKWLQANPKVKGFANDLLGSEKNIAADKHFMRMLAMSDGGADFLSNQAQISGENLAALRKLYKKKLDPYIQTRKTGTGQMVTITNLQKAVEDGVIKDTKHFKSIPQAWLDMPKPTEYAALEQMAQRLAKRYDMTPAQFQASLWMGAGDITALADESQGTAMELFRRTLDKRAGERGLTRKEMASEFIHKRAPLAIGGGLLGGAAYQGAEQDDPNDQPVY
jgi:hypothetical protein